MNGVLATLGTEHEKIGDTNYCSIRQELSIPYVIASISYQIIGILLPSVLILVFCIVLIVFLVHCRSIGISSSTTARKIDNQILVQLAAIVTSFVVGYSFDFAVKVYAVSRKFLIHHDVLAYLGLATHGVLRVCECINPFLYYVVSIAISKPNVGVSLQKSRSTACFQGAIQSHSEALTGRAHTDERHGGSEVVAAMGSIPVDLPSNKSTNVVLTTILSSFEEMPDLSTKQNSEVASRRHRVQ